MPRGRRKIVPKSVEERLIDVETAIEQKKAELSTLRELRKEILIEKEKAEMSELYEVVRQSGHTPAELMDIIQRDPQY